MNIDNQLGQLNISNGVSLREDAIVKAPQQKFVPDSFQRGIYVTAPKKTFAALSSINAAYSPNQLLNAYLNPSYLKFLVDTNPNIQNMLNEHGLEGKIYPENISKISKSHITSTTAIARQIANQLNISQADKQILEQACVFHDFGKVLIPKEILLKPSQLSDSEKEIMDLHAELGAELLSTTGMNSRVTDLVRNHHDNNAENADILGQILSVADIYSALREERSYKASVSEEDALSLLDQKAQNGEVSAEAVDALKASLSAKSVYTE